MAILLNRPDVHTKVGRHLWAGALGVASLSMVELLIALYPLRRGEKWAFWAAATPFVLLNVPVLVLDAAYARRQFLVNTLAPLVLGLCVGVMGLSLSAFGLFARPSAD